MPNTSFPDPRGGTDKHRAMAYLLIKVGDNERHFYAYVRASYTGSIDIRDNTNAASSIDQGQIMREETPTFEIETNIPFNATQAKDTINFLRAGRIVSAFDVKNRDGSGVFKDGYLQQYGSYIIERSTIDISRDDMTTVRATVRALGYTRAKQLDPVVLPV